MQVAIYAGVPAGVDSFRIAREAFAEVDGKKSGSLDVGEQSQRSRTSRDSRMLAPWRSASRVQAADERDVSR